MGFLAAILALLPQAASEEKAPVTLRMRESFLQGPVKGEDKETVRYQIGVPFQVSTTQAAILLNIRRCASKVVDVEAGTDVVVFDRLEDARAENAYPINRSKEEKDPRNGKPILLVRYPTVGGFIPRGATLPDGKPHPHAGTGFGLLCVMGFPVDNSVPSPANSKDVYWAWELEQYRFDGKRFKVTSVRRVETTKLLAGWNLFSYGMSMALPDGEDLLSPLVGAPSGGKPGAGLSRWRCDRGTWKITDYVPVSGPDSSMEPSAVRDADGSLLFCVRGACDDLPAVGLRRDPEREKSFLVWRSTDGGRTWSELINLRDKRGATPVTICLTAEGRPFIAGNDIIPGAHPMRMRQKLSLWPLTADRKGVEGPSFTFDCLTQFGPTPGGSLWHMDHPYNAIVRLADGKPRSLLVMRVCEANEVGGGAPPTPRTGCWIAEVVTGR